MQKNFSIVEVLIITGMICLLTTLLLPALYGTVTRNRLAACSNKLRLLGNAIQFYCNDNKSLIPNNLPGMELSSASILRTHDGQILGLGRLVEKRYLPGAEILGCPDSPGHNGSSVKSNWLDHRNIVWSGYLYRSQDCGFDPRLNSAGNINKALVMDFACKNLTGKRFAPHNYRNSNLLYADNHVECRLNTPVPFEFYTIQAISSDPIDLDCIILWQHADQ
jgi:prepilin-type processing-associated H-X9-DG protein